MRRVGGAAGEAVYEDVDEELEALVRVGEGELIGESGHIREGSGGERGDVVAGHVRGLLAAVRVGGRDVGGGVGDVVDAGLVDGEAVDGGDQEQIPLDGQAWGEAAGAQDGQDALGVAQGVGAHGDAADRDPDDPGVAQAGGALVAGDLFDLLPPAVRFGVRDLALADDLVHDQVEEAVLATDVPVEGGGAGTELVGELAHAQGGQALAVEEPDGGGDDRVAGHGVAAAAGRAFGRALPGRRRDLRIAGGGGRGGVRRSSGARGDGLCMGGRVLRHGDLAFLRNTSLTLYQTRTVFDSNDGP
jgi:hypothetical protein